MRTPAIQVLRRQAKPPALPRPPSHVEIYDAMSKNLAVGDCLRLDYTEAKSCINRLRKHRDGRRWSLLPFNDGTADYGVWRNK
jgi:hypothetical protein